MQIYMLIIMYCNGSADLNRFRHVSRQASCVTLVQANHNPFQVHLRFTPGSPWTLGRFPLNFKSSWNSSDLTSFRDYSMFSMVVCLCYIYHSI